MLNKDILVLKSYMGSVSDTGIKSSIRKLKDYLEITDGKIPLCQYTASNWEKFFEWGITHSNAISSTKTRIKNFLKENNYPDSVIDSISQCDKTKYGGTNYILNYKLLSSKIAQARDMEIGQSYVLALKHDKYSSLEMALYLLWLGFTLPEIISLKRYDFDYVGKVITAFNRQTAIPSELVNIFQKYAEADGFFVDREHGAKPIFYTYERENDEFICSSNNGRYSLPSLIRLLQDMGFEHDVVWMSGKFYNAFQKHLRRTQCSLENKNVTAKDIMDYFELNEDYQIKRQDIFIFRYDWERYKRQQKEYIDSGIVPNQCSRRRVKSKINV